MVARGAGKGTALDQELQLPHEEFSRLRRRWTALLGALKEARTEARDARAEARDAQYEVEDANAEVARLHEVVRQLQAAYDRTRRELVEASGEAAYWRALAEARLRDPGLIDALLPLRQGTSEEPEAGWRELAQRLLTLIGNPPGSLAAAAAAATQRSPPPASRYPRPPSASAAGQAPLAAEPQAPRTSRGQRPCGGASSHSPVWRQRQRVAQAEAADAAREEALRWRRLAEQRGEELRRLRSRQQDRSATSDPVGEGDGSSLGPAAATGGTGGSGGFPPEVTGTHWKASRWNAATGGESTDGGNGSSTGSPEDTCTLAQIYTSPTPARSRVARFQILLSEPGLDAAGDMARGPMTEYFNIGSPRKGPAWLKEALARDTAPPSLDDSCVSSAPTDVLRSS